MEDAYAVGVDDGKLLRNIESTNWRPSPPEKFWHSIELRAEWLRGLEDELKEDPKQ